MEYIKGIFKEKKDDLKEAALLQWKWAVGGSLLICAIGFLTGDREGLLTIALIFPVAVSLIQGIFYIWYGGKLSSFWENYEKLTLDQRTQLDQEIAQYAKEKGAAAWKLSRQFGTPEMSYIFTSVAFICYAQPVLIEKSSVVKVDYQLSIRKECPIIRP